MKPNSHLLNLGQQLKEERVRQALSLQQMAKKTKISADTLQAIEEGLQDKFPVYTYLRGFILSYAQALEMDPTALLKELKTLFPAPTAEEPTGKKINTNLNTDDLAGSELHITPVLLAGGLLLILVLILTLSNWKEKKEELNSAVETEEQETTEEVVYETAVDEPAQEKELRVIVKAVQNTIFSSQIDEEDVRNITLKKNQFEVLNGKKKIWIKTDRADYIHIFYNDEELGLFGGPEEKEQTFSIQDK